MTIARVSARTAAAAALALTAGLLVTGCGGDDGGAGASAEDVTAALTEAKENFDDATGVHFTMKTDAKPSGDAVLGADGDLTDQPAFEGKVKVVYKGFNVDVPVVSVDGKVYANLPLSGGFDEIDPAEFNAPDPADFIDPAKGISGLLLELDGAKQTDEKRAGKEIVTTYTGELSGDRVATIIPSASKDGAYETVVGIADGKIVTLEITGDFFDESSDVTYELAFDQYGEIGKIKAP